MKLKAIAINTFKEAVRNKVFYLLIFFGIFFSFSSRIISLLTIGDTSKVIKDIGLGSINFFSVLIAVFTGINLVFKEIDKKTVYNILSKPVRRRDFILGKFLGLAFTLFVALILMAVVFLFFLYIFSGNVDPGLMLYFLFLYCELLILISVSILFSSFSTPILSSVFTILIYFIGHFVWTFNEFKHKITGTLEKAVAYFFYYIFPNLEKFNIKNSVVMGETIEPVIFFSTILYGLFFVIAILSLSIYIFNKREF